MCRLILAAFLIAVFLTGCETLSIAPAQGPTVQVPAELKLECPPLPLTDGSLANLARLAVDDAREYAKCRERHNALVDVVNEIERQLK